MLYTLILHWFLQETGLPLLHRSLKIFIFSISLQSINSYLAIDKERVFA